jgi:hypothetical protein
MTFEELLDQAIAMLKRRGRRTYSTLKRQFQFDDTLLEDLKNQLIAGRRLVVDEQGNILVWTGIEGSFPHPAALPASRQHHPPLTYTPTHLIEKILTAEPTLEEERSRSRCSLPTSRTRRNSLGTLIPLR